MRRCRESLIFAFMQEAEELYHEIISGVIDAKPGKMFGAQCLKTPNGKAALMYYKGCMVFKLTGDAEKEALALDGAHYFDPMEGRPMNGWVQLDYTHRDKWPYFTRKSIDYVKALPAK
jgi:hypothetical protein